MSRGQSAPSPPQSVAHLPPGAHFVGDSRWRVHTLLGSCVSITLWQPRWRIGAMSHFLLAERSSGAGDALDARFAGDAMALMLRGLAAHGVAPGDCEAKLFGGADMFPGASHSLQVGRRNGDAAYQLLARQGIELVSHSLFGTQHRRIVFDIATGHVWSQHNRQGGADTAPAPLLPASSAEARAQA